MPQVITITVPDAFVPEITSCGTCVQHGGIDGLIRKVIYDAIMDKRRCDSACAAPPVPDFDQGQVTIEIKQQGT